MQKDKYDHKKWEMLKVALYSFGKEMILDMTFS